MNFSDEEGGRDDWSGGWLEGMWWWNSMKDDRTRCYEKI